MSMRFLLFILLLAATSTVGAPRKWGKPYKKGYTLSDDGATWLFPSSHCQNQNQNQNQLMPSYRENDDNGFVIVNCDRPGPSPPINCWYRRGKPRPHYLRPHHLSIYCTPTQKKGIIEIQNECPPHCHDVLYLSYHA
ncbi:hypothetical protein FA10DRAFT_269400 [Acaromyces ingoldii]|uniref:Ig-like domain-containing protein n=1 Tax=Acaromyces ingoldii TaxID=215250 RepID=A0A316YH57_9BASI|nr:hypothetical protein FA10DRAFT_269400 [Acaromyces ingoldii]PWN87443.1 hypothetical protein FA10DRAFT_269400 [Acaromyces ingoldii]